MKVLIDTNIIVDVALDREPFFAESDRILTLAEEGQIQGYISASTLATFTRSFAETKVAIGRWIFCGS